MGCISTHCSNEHRVSHVDIITFLGFKSQHIDFTLEFSQALIDTPTYLNLPTGFSVERQSNKCVMELKKMLYGLHRTGLNWYETLHEHLISIGFKQSLQDPGCFMRDNLVLLCYVDDCLIFCKDEAKIKQVVEDLKQKFTLED